MTTTYKTNNGVVFACIYQVVWCPKYRRSVLTPEILAVLKGLVEQVCAARDAEILGLSLGSDQVELKVVVDPQFGIHRLIKEIKAVSSGALRQQFSALRTRLPTLWSNSYFVTTARVGSAKRLAQFLEDQKETPPRRRPNVSVIPELLPT
jgi:putative transposase